MALILADIFAGGLCLKAVEKHWIAHEAQTILVGTLTPNQTIPWFDGWHMNGVITVDDILFGDRLPTRINLRFVCKWEGLCQRWPPPQYPKVFTQRGLWFLRRIDQNTWESSLGFPDIGFRNLSDRAYWENYIRLYKR